MNSYDPELHARMIVPYTTREEAEVALAAFLDDVRIAREKHRIAHVTTAALVNLAENTLAQHGGFGDSEIIDSMRVAAFMSTRSGEALADLVDEIAYSCPVVVK